MGIFRNAFMAADAPTQEKPVKAELHEHYGNIPSMPVDIRMKSGKDTGGKARGGVASRVTNNPVVLAGMGLTAAAILGMMVKSFKGDKAGTQKYMQYRIVAQFATVAALVGGVAFLGMSYKKTEKK